MTAIVATCTVQGCCIAHEHKDLNELKKEAALVITSATATVINELCQNVYQLPNSLLRLSTDVWKHIKREPKKPTWNIQTTVVMGFLQAFRDQNLTNSLEFWRLVLIAPTFLTPITCRIVPESIPIIRRDLPGIVKKLDDQENGLRTLDAEWVSAISAWEKIYGGHTQSNIIFGKKAPLLLDVAPSCEKIIMYLHGGAYCSMSAQTHRTLTHKISKSTKRRVLAVNYRLAPETRFPGALYDVVQTFLHLIDSNGKHHYDPKNIIIMGDSAGGGLCLSMLLYLRDHQLPLPEGSILISPWVDLTFSYPSWKEASLYDYLPADPNELKAMNPALLYLENIDMVRHPYVSPVFADNFDHLPPIMIQSGGCECLRDEIADITSKIQSSKTSVVHHEIYEDMVHVFQAFPFVKSAEAIDSIGWWAKIGIPFINQWQTKQKVHEQCGVDCQETELRKLRPVSQH
ncbi:alpha/beta hydrolase fold-domain-containing protein [Pilobolus umbonatus]|nr:alpha/beta hydrolase fold-domain-containing protein [Pilobolus umbonatus]